MEHFHPYLLGREFSLRTDHGSLSWLQSFKKPEGQLARWLEKLQEYHFNIVHWPGKNHADVDIVSCQPCDQCWKDEPWPGNDGCYEPHIHRCINCCSCWTSWWFLVLCLHAGSRIRMEGTSFTSGWSQRSKERRSCTTYMMDHWGLIWERRLHSPIIEFLLSF